MPSPAPSPKVPTAMPTGIVFMPSNMKWPDWGPMYPSAGPLGMLTVAAAYFALGVAVGSLLKASPRGRRWLPVLVVPGLVAAAAYLVWVIRSIQ